MNAQDAHTKAVQVREELVFECLEDIDRAVQIALGQGEYSTMVEVPSVVVDDIQRELEDCLYSVEVIEEDLNNSMALLQVDFESEELDLSTEPPNDGMQWLEDDFS